MGLIDGIAGLISTGVNAWSTSNENDKNRQHDVDMANLEAQLNEDAAVSAYERSIDAWELDNEYNSATNQRARLEQAGINPATAFSSGVSTTSGNSSQSIQSPAGGASAHSTPGRAPQLNPQDFLTMAQARKLEAETNAIKETTPLTIKQIESNVLGTELENTWKSTSMPAKLEMLKVAQSVQELDYDFKSDTFDSRVAATDEQLQKLRVEVSEISERAKQLGFRNEYESKQLLANIISTYSNIGTDVLDSLLNFLNLANFLPKKSKSYHRTNVDKKGDVSESYGTEMFH